MKTCSVDGCEREHIARGYCSMHYQRAVAGLPIGPATTMRVRGKCTQCEREAKAKGLCPLHYQAARRDPVKKRQKRLGVDPCIVDGCDRKYQAHGMCALHYGRFLRTGAVGSVGTVKGAKGSGHLDRSGYRYIQLGGRRYLEHRHVMELILGRPLWSDETVHHKNGQRADNRPENLELWSKMQPAGQRVEDKVAFAIEVLGRYRPELLVNP